MYQESMNPQSFGTSGISIRPENETLVLHIQGGLGKCIMATAVIRSYKAANPKTEIVVVSGYPEVFLHNPDVHKNFPFNTPYLWKDYYNKLGSTVHAQDPYLDQAWIKNHKRHLIDVWCGMLRVPNIQKTPLLYFSGAEVDELQSMIQVHKPLLVIQSTGGSNPASRSWTRNPPKKELEDFISNYKKTHFIVHLAVKDTPTLQNIDQRIDTFDRRKAMCLFYYAQEVIGIDSFGLHARAANLSAGPSKFFLPLAESKYRLGYENESFEFLIPTEEVQEMLRDHQDYYATTIKLGIDSASENCPIPAGIKWFN